MHILVTGASGFIGSHLLPTLLRQGHRITATARNPDILRGHYPEISAQAIDFSQALHPADWLPLLQDVDAVINTAGIIRESVAQDFCRVHEQAPIALFKACELAEVKRVIQISALGADEGAESRFHLTKKAADDFLASRDLAWTVLRPSIVYGPGARSMAFFKALAALPVTPLVNRGEQRIQPIHVDDLVSAVLCCLQPGGPSGARIDLVGPEPVSFLDLMRRLRRWLGLGSLRPLALPYGLSLAMAKAGGFLGGAPVTPASVRMLRRGNTGSVDGFRDHFGFPPRSLATALREEPARQAERWHAGLYFISPLLRFTLFLVWSLAGLVSAFVYPQGDSYALLAGVGLKGGIAVAALYGAAAWDLLLGLGTLSRRWLRPVLYGQLLTMLLYTLILSLFLPAFWAHPFGPVVKNLPLALATAILLVLQRRPQWNT